jgi:hypothetical protein
MRAHVTTQGDRSAAQRMNTGVVEKAMTARVTYRIPRRSSVVLTAHLVLATRV